LAGKTKKGNRGIGVATGQGAHQLLDCLNSQARLRVHCVSRPVFKKQICAQRKAAKWALEGEISAKTAEKAGF
jgi:hypothetical protein